jgi:UDP-N-acetylglucosamine--N-acetylmuramyl-(pentapeptide) pyrophosphoryl-undecaprenol N-acetylglucosamine transferase
MATSEFLALGLPAVLVPLPTAAADHQSRNAEALAAAGAAIRLPEAGLEGADLLVAIAGLVGDPGARQAMAGAARARGRPEAATEIARDLATFLTPIPEAS